MSTSELFQHVSVMEKQQYLSNDSPSHAIPTPGPPILLLFSWCRASDEILNYRFFKVLRLSITRPPQITPMVDGIYSLTHSTHLLWLKGDRTTKQLTYGVRGGRTLKPLGHQKGSKSWSSNTLEPIIPPTSAPPSKPHPTPTPTIYGFPNLSHQL